MKTELLRRIKSRYTFAFRELDGKAVYVARDRAGRDRYTEFSTRLLALDLSSEVIGKWGTVAELLYNQMGV
jgi:hypothetical protein